MRNTATRNARELAGLGDLHVHDLRHTAAVRLREVGIGETTIADVLWHLRATLTQHYASAQLLEPRTALEWISDESMASNKLLLTLAAEGAAQAPGGRSSPFNVLSARKRA